MTAELFCYCYCCSVVWLKIAAHFYCNKRWGHNVNLLHVPNALKRFFTRSFVCLFVCVLHASHERSVFLINYILKLFCEPILLIRLSVAHFFSLFVNREFIMRIFKWTLPTEADSTLKNMTALISENENDKTEKNEEAFKFKYFIFNYAFYMHLHGCLSVQLHDGAEPNEKRNGKLFTHLLNVMKEIRNSWLNWRGRKIDFSKNEASLLRRLISNKH